MGAEALPLRAYSREELLLLAAEGRLKGRGISSLADLRPGRDPTVSRKTFEARAARLPCWTDPLPLLRTFLDLVDIPSPSGREEEVAGYLSGRLKALEFQRIERDGIGNLTAVLPAVSKRAPTLLFTAHMDCVYPGNGTPVQPVFRASGEIRTDGGNSLGADDKAGIAAMVSTLDYIRRARLPHGEIRVLFTVQEERGYRGVKQVPASVLNAVHLVVGMDPPVRVGRNETAHMAVLHMVPGHPFFDLIREAAFDCGLQPTMLFAEEGYVGGDTICLSPLGAQVVDFCSGSRYPHTPHEHLHAGDLVGQTSWMIAAVERVLSFDASALELRAVYGDEPIGSLTGARKPVPLAAALRREKLDLARTLHTRPGPDMVPALAHLSALAPRAGDAELLEAVVEAYRKGLRQDHVPRVLRDLMGALVHLASNLADVRHLEPLIPAVQEVMERGGDESAQLHGLHVFEALFQKERRVAVRARVLRILILSLQSSSEALVREALRFFRTCMGDTIHALTVAFCNRQRSGWERAARKGAGRIVGGRGHAREEGVRWTVLRQRILRLLLEEDRLLPEMLEWIFAHDEAATQEIAAGFIDPDRNPAVAGRILQNLKSRRPGVQETAVRFAGTHRMAQTAGPLVGLLLSPHLCRNRSLVEWALDAIGAPGLDEVIGRLGDEEAFAPFVRRMFNRYDRSTDDDFERLGERFRAVYGPGMDPDDPLLRAMLSAYLGEESPDAPDALTRWDRRRALVLYDHLFRLYPDRRDLERLTEALADAETGTRSHFVHMAVQKNIFQDPDFMSLVARENPRFLEQFVRMEKQVPRRVLLGRLREFMAGAQLDPADPQDVEVYYLYLLKQSVRMPDRTRYLKHIEQARHHLFPPLKPYCRAFTIAGDRIEEVGTVDRRRIRTLIAGLPRADGREARLRALLLSDLLARRERQRLINGLAEAFGVDVGAFSTLEDRAGAVLKEIDFEFDAAYRPVPQVVYPLLLRVRMKHREEVVVPAMADYAVEYALVNHPEIRDVFDSGELDLVLDNLNDLLTDRVYEAEGELSEDVFGELRKKHVAALGRFYTTQWKGIVRDLKRRFPTGRPSELIAATERAMLDYDVLDEEEADLLDTNLNRLVQVLRPADAGLLSYHVRHREFFKVYAAVLRARNLRQLKRVYREVYRRLQDEVSYASREHDGPPEPASRRALLRDGTDPEEDGTRRVRPGPGYLKYARKELGKLGKLMSDFVLERALSVPVETVRSEITKLRQVVVGTSQILCVPVKDVSVVYRSWPGNDCNTGDIRQVLCPDGSFYKIISGGAWKGYFTLVEVSRKGERALLLDVLNYSGLRMENENFIRVLMHHVIRTAAAQGFAFVLTSSYDNHLSNRDYIRRAFRKVFPALGTVQGFGLSCTPTAAFQSLVPNLAVVWKNDGD